MILKYKDTSNKNNNWNLVEFDQVSVVKDVFIKLDDIKNLDLCVYESPENKHKVNSFDLNLGSEVNKQTKADYLDSIDAKLIIIDNKKKVVVAKDNPLYIMNENGDTVETL